MHPGLRHFFAGLAGLLFAGTASATGLLDPALAQRLASGSGPHDVVVTFKTTSDANALAGLGVNFFALRQLPMAGARLTTVQVQLVRNWPSVESIYFNAALQYSNYTSGQITGGHYVHDNLGVKGLGSTIAVLDSGIDANHPDLAFGPKVVQNVKLVGDLGLLGVSRAIEDVPNTDTTSGHGTHVAGTAGGTGAASASDARRPFAYAGIAPQASLIGLGAGEGLNILHALIGFDWVLQNQQRYGIDIVTNSWGGGDGADFDPNNPINRASYECYRRGIVVTFAASNSGPDENTLSQYAIAPWVINVAAGTPTRGLADFSSRGVAGDFYKHPDVTAPGEDITSTRAPGTVVGALGPVTDPAHPEYTLYYHTISGTSMATPFTAGSAGLLLGANPQLSPDQVEEILMQTADPMAGLAFHQVGAGYIDVREAVERAMATPGNRAAFLAGDIAWSSQGVPPDGTQLVEESQTFTGTMGPSALDMEVDRYPITVGADVRLLKASLGWTGGGDIDLYLVDPSGARVTAAASTANPETLEYTVSVPGTYTYEVTGYAVIAASYTLTSTQARVVPP